MIRKPRLGFLGVGWIGRKRLESVAACGLADIVAIADPVAENRYAVLSGFPSVASHTSLDSLLDEDLDGVVIATPNALHHDQVIASLRAGCAVFCQKPLGRNHAEVQRMIEAAAVADRLLGIDLSYRHVRALREIRRLVHETRLGRVYAATFTFHNAYGPDKPWFYDERLSGGGCLLDLGVHLIDSAVWIFGGKPRLLSSHLFQGGSPLRPGGVEDYAMALLEFENYIVVRLECSWRLQAGQAAIIEARFHGTEGGARFSNVDGSFTEFRADQFQGTNAQRLVDPPDDWGSGAIVQWAEQLSFSPRFNPEIREHELVAELLDAAYGRNPPAPLDTIP
jgi:predicted dehydrogenase